MYLRRASVRIADAPPTNIPSPSLAPQIGGLATGTRHVLAPATAFGKNVLPRVAAGSMWRKFARSGGGAPDTFRRPIYAGNAILTVQSAGSIKVITVRAPRSRRRAEGGSAAIEPCRGPFRPLALCREELPGRNVPN